jgi:uncharacterized protein (TIGR00730 family)
MIKKKMKSKKIDKRIGSKHFHVTIFGSSRIKKNDPVYKQVKKLAGMIGERNIDVVTGGGPGIMEAANEGHRKGTKNNGGDSHSIGLGIKLPHEQGFNDSVQLHQKFEKFSRRLDNFMLMSNAIVVAPGGIGTMLELFYTWQLMQVKHICHIPFILLGKQWGPFIDWMEKYPLKKKYLDKEDMNLVFLADTCEEAIKIIEKAHKHWKEGDKNFCLNYKKYKLE